MFTEISDNYGRHRVRGWILYDGACSLCIGLVRRSHNVLAPEFRFEPLQSPWVREVLGVTEEQLLAEMRVLTRTGNVLGGADAVVYLARSLKPAQRPWWAWLALVVSRIPGSIALLHSGYRWFAARRHCGDAGCQTGILQASKKVAKKEVRQ